MRIARSKHLHLDSAAVHMYWRCHNKEFYLNSPEAKKLYLESLERSLKRKSSYQNSVRINAFCLMGNHCHQLIDFCNSSTTLSNHMRYSHGIFGAKYNRKNSRCGKVAMGRPQTSLLQNSEHQMRVHFYIEANPLRAGLCSLNQLRFFSFNSYKFFAFGIKDRLSKLLTIPDWYLRLGKNPKERQRKYRALFAAYLNREKKCATKFLFLKKYIGDTIWIECQMKSIRKKIIAVSSTGNTS